MSHSHIDTWFPIETYHCCWIGFVEEHLDHKEAGIERRLLIVDASIGLCVNFGKGQTDIPPLLFGKRFVPIGYNRLADDGSTQRHGSHPIIVAIVETGSVVTGGIIHCNK